MAKSFNLEIEGLEKLQQKLNKLPAKITKLIDLEIDAGAKEINAGQLRLVPVDEGRLKQSLSVAKTKNLEREIVTNAFYAPYIEFGTKSQVSVPSELTAFAAQFKGGTGAKGSFDDFLLVILDWVHRKGIAGRFSTKSKRRVGNKNTQLQEDFEAAFPIALSILRKGIKPHPFFFPPFLIEKPKIINNIAQVINNL